MNNAAKIVEENGVWYMDNNGIKINLYAKSLEEAERYAAEIRPMPTTALPAGSLSAYTSGEYDRQQGQIGRRRSSKRAR